ncbi:MAG: hypothetical protein ABIE94_02085 [archaeon]
MTSKVFKKSILWAVVIILLLAVLLPSFGLETGAFFNYAVAIALIYLVFRTPLDYAK